MSFEFFSKKLNYTLANEDTATELAILPRGLKHVVAVAGSGGRVLPLFAQNPQHVSCVDLSLEQLMLTELRIAAAQVLQHSEFLSFFGYPGGDSHAETRKSLFQQLELTPATREFFIGLFEAIEWQSLLYLGRWEKSFKTISRIVQSLVGERVLEVFSKKTMVEQRRFMVEGFPDLRWRMALFALGNSALFNALLYKGHFPSNNVARSYFRFYEESFNRIFAKTLARENFFLQVVLYGELRHPEGNPIECSCQTYERVQQGIRGATVSYHADNIVDWIKTSDSPVDFLSFSDVPSYFSDYLAASFMQDIAPRLTPGALTVVRSYMHRPPGVNLAGFRDVAHRYVDAIDTEKTQMYFVDVYERES